MFVGLAVSSRLTPLALASPRKSQLSGGGQASRTGGGTSKARKPSITSWSSIFWFCAS